MIDVLKHIRGIKGDLCEIKDAFVVITEGKK